MKRYLISITALVLVIQLSSFGASTELVTNDKEVLGEVVIENDHEFIFVTYAPQNGWYLTAAQVAIANTPADFPQTKKGNAIPGKFAYKLAREPWTAKIPLNSAAAGDTVYIAAHGCAATDGDSGGSWSYAPGELAVLPLNNLEYGFQSAQITVAVVGENLVVTFTDMFGMPFSETCLYVGQLPRDPDVPDSFPYVHSQLGYVVSDSFVLPLADLNVSGETLLYIDAEATVGYPAGYLPDGSLDFIDMLCAAPETTATVIGVYTPGQSEPAQAGVWAAGYDFPGENKAMYFEYSIE